jgi:AraC-like DNA-binding protein
MQRAKASVIARVRLIGSRTLRCRACRAPLIMRLYETRHDNLPEPTRHVPVTAGFVHETFAPTVCPTCDGLDRHCPTCRGRFEIETRRTRDPYSVDHVPAAGTATAKLGHESARDAELARLAGQTRAPFASTDDELEDANEHPYAWERARATMYARFDYRALDRALELLHVQHPGVPDLSPYGLAFIDSKMPEKIRAPRVAPAVQSVPAKGVSVGDRALAERDQLAVRLLNEGLSHTEVARRVGLSARQLRRIVNERTEAA